MYETVLAEIHDKWFSEIAIKAAHHVASRASQLSPFRWVDAGCGSGSLLKEIQGDCVELSGFDISESMIEIAKKKIGSGTFFVSDIMTAKIPQSNVVTIVGEILSYATSSANFTFEALLELFQRIYENLSKNGLLLFDVLGKDYDYSGKFLHDREFFTVFSEVSQTSEIVTRNIISFLTENGKYVKSKEVHRLRMFDAFELEKILKDVGFEVVQIDRYDSMLLLPGRIAFECWKRV